VQDKGGCLASRDPKKKEKTHEESVASAAGKGALHEKRKEGVLSPQAPNLSENGRTLHTNERAANLPRRGHMN